MSLLVAPKDVCSLVHDRFEINLTDQQSNQICSLASVEHPTDEMVWLKAQLVRLNMFPPGMKMPRANCKTVMLHIQTIEGGMKVDDFRDLLIAGWPEKHIDRLPLATSQTKFRRGRDAEVTNNQYSNRRRTKKRVYYD